MSHANLLEMFKLLTWKDPLTQPLIAVIGDVMLDQHVTCTVQGISPEDDLAWKLKQTSTRYSPGGAANVAVNIAKLGGNVTLLGHIGRGWASNCLSESLMPVSNHLGSIWYDPAGRTTTKSRYITPHGRHIVRIDDETEWSLPTQEVEAVIADLKRLKPRLIVVSDYAKGMITSQLMEAIDSVGIPYLVDPKRPFDFYRNPFMITPNEKEFRKAVTGCDTTEAPIADLFRELAGCDAGSILITRAQHGAQLWHRAVMLTPVTFGDPSFNLALEFKAFVRTHGDPTGCGDALIASLAFALAHGWDANDAVRLGIAAGSCAFDHTGVYAVTPADIIKELERGDPHGRTMAS